jgi:pimeloyl-ACP methyl ester carboxylesterase
MHGLGGSPDGYEPLLRSVLAPPPGKGAVRVIAIWMRSESGAHTMSDQLVRARKAIDAEPGPVMLMGHSFGGKAALKLAAEYPASKVPGIIALAPSVNMLQSYWKRVAGERVLPAPEQIEPKLAEIEAHLRQQLKVAEARFDEDRVDTLRSNLSYAVTMRDLVHHDEPGIEANVTRPTLVFHGTEDEAVSIHYARRFAETNAKSVTFVELPGTNHGFRSLDSRGTLRAMRDPIRDFLTKTAPASAVALPHVAAPAVATVKAVTLPPAKGPAVAAPDAAAKTGFFGRMWR